MSEQSTETGFLLRNLMEHMTDNIYFKDLDSHIIMANRAFREWTGLSEEQMIGKSDFDLFASAHAKEAYRDEQKIIASGDPVVGLEEKETWADGRITWVLTSKMPLRNSEGAIIGTFGISRDITEHKEAELQAAYFADQVSRIKDQMEKDLRMAAELQKTFFPAGYPVYPPGAEPGNRCIEFLHQYHASGTVSGDFCTIIPLGPKQVGLFQCDVMGHGVRAALVTAVICTLVEETSLQEKDPGRFLSRMNDQLIPLLRQEDVFLYATACYMVFDVESGVLKYANAGHPVPLHIQGESGRADWLMKDASQRGPALAIVEETEFQTFEQQIRPDDRVMMYTDGLYEMPDAAGHEYGDLRLLEMAAQLAQCDLAELISGLMNDAKDFSKDGVFEDDICMIGFKCASLLGEKHAC